MLNSAHSLLVKRLIDEAMYLAVAGKHNSRPDIRVCACSVSAAIRYTGACIGERKPAGMFRFEVMIDGAPRAILINVAYLINHYQEAYV